MTNLREPSRRDFLAASAFGLVAQLDNTGDSTAPNKVRDYMINLMAKHGYGSKLVPGFEHMTPEKVLGDKHYAIVEVYGYLPPSCLARPARSIMRAQKPSKYDSSR